MRIGELIFPILTKRYFGLAYMDGLQKLIWIRVFDALIIAIALTILVVPNLPFSLVPLFFIVLCLILGGCGVAFTFRKHNILRNIFLRFVLQLPKDKYALCQIIFWSLLTWLSKLSAFALVLHSISGKPFEINLMGALGAEISSLLPIHGIAGTGSFEAGFVLAASSLVHTSNSLLAAAINLHLFVLVSTTLVFLVFLPLKVVSSSRELTNAPVNSY